MFIKTLKASLPFFVNTRTPIYLHGRHGIGKSQVPKQFAEVNSFKFVYLNLGTQSDAGDILGLADFMVNDKGEKIATKFFIPDWAYQTIEYCKNNPKSKAIIMLDEINRAKRDLIQVVFPLVLEGRLHTTQFPENCYFMAGGNPNTDDYQVLDISDKAFLSRFVHIKLTPSVNEWIDYAESISCDKDILNFIKEQPEMLEASTEDFNLDFVKPDRRRWLEQANTLKKAGMPLELLQEACYGIMGHAVTTAFFEAMKNSDKPYEAEEILDGYSAEVTKKLKKWNKNRQDLVNETGKNVLKFIEKTDKLATKQLENLMTFLKEIPAELSFSLCQGLYLQELCREAMDNDNDLIKLLRKGKTGKAEV
jgi:AAA domain (dynein-related subfamily)